MSNTTTGLMRKTKKELIDIILRKDDVEAKCKEHIGELEKIIDDNSEQIDFLKQEKHKLNVQLNESEKSIATMNTYNYNTNIELNNTKRINKVFKIWAIAATVAAIILLGFVIF